MRLISILVGIIGGLGIGCLWYAILHPQMTSAQVLLSITFWRGWQLGVAGFSGCLVGLVMYLASSRDPSLRKKGPPRPRPRPIPSSEVLAAQRTLLRQADREERLLEIAEELKRQEAPRGTPEERVEAWNACHKPGDPVRYTDAGGESKRSTVSSEAYLIESVPVVRLEGRRAVIALWRLVDL
jgi:hypothetical protein